MSDLVQRLRESIRACRALDRSELLEEAAAEIERLRAVTEPMPIVASGIGSVTLTDAEREAVNIAQNLLAGTAHGKSLGSLLERLG